MKVVVVGAGLVGLTYALFLKDEGFEVEVFEKREEAEIDNLSSLIYVKAPALQQLAPYINKYLFDRTQPKAFLSYPRRKLFTADYYANIKISDLLHALLEKAKESGVTIHRGKLFQGIQQDDVARYACFSTRDDDKVIDKVPYDQILLACGNRDIKPVLEKNNAPKPVELHCLNMLVSKADTDLADIDPHRQATTAIYGYPDSRFNYLTLQTASFFDSTIASAGKTTMYFATPTDLNFLVTFAPELKAEFEHDKVKRGAYLRAAFKHMRENIHTQDSEPDFTWLAGKENLFTDDKVFSVIAAASVLLPNIELFKKGMIPIGDAFVAAPFIWGSEFNVHVSLFFPILLKTLKALEQAKTEDEILDTYTHFVEDIWEFLNNKHVKRYLELAEPFGNTVLPDGTHLNPRTGYKITRELLETIQREQNNDWIDYPDYQAGGFLTLPAPPHSNVAPLKRFGLYATQTPEASATVSDDAVSEATQCRY